jgi:hypothetical protein
MLKQISFCRDAIKDSVFEPVSPQVLFAALMPLSPITDCVWQEHKFVTGLMSQDEVSL